MSKDDAGPRDLPRDGERVFYIRDSRTQPIGCLAYRREGDTVRFAASFLHPNDAFDRRRARLIALGRLRVKPLEIVIIDECDRPLSVALTRLLARADTPFRIKQALYESIERRAAAP